MKQQFSLPIITKSARFFMPIGIKILLASQVWILKFTANFCKIPKTKGRNKNRFRTTGLLKIVISAHSWPFENLPEAQLKTRLAES